MSIEFSRKHGPFDLRWPPTRHKPGSSSLWHLGEQPVDWEVFLARFYPGRRRHDLDALAAYESYLNDVERRRAGDCPLPGSLPRAVHVTGSDDALRKGDEEALRGAAETARWESEGGAVGGTLATTDKGGRHVATQKVFGDVARRVR